jgi:hypothetical protein
VREIRNTTREQEAAWAFIARTMVDPESKPADAVDREFFRNGKPSPGFFLRLAWVAAEDANNEVVWKLGLREFQAHRRRLPSFWGYIMLVQQFPPSKQLLNQLSPQDVNRTIQQLTVGLVQFQPDPEKVGEYYQARGSWARIYRNAVVEGTVEIRKRTEGACLVASGTVCDDVWPVVSVWIEGEMIGRRYIRSTRRFAYALPVVLEPGTYKIGVGLENDRFNAFTRRDRNLEIHDIRFY